MPIQKNKHQKLHIIISLAFLVAVIGLIYFYSNHTGDIKRSVKANDDHKVNVTAKINFNPSIVVHPEKRIPRNSNWSNLNVVDIREKNDTNILITQVVNTNNLGEGELAQIDIDNLSPGRYDVTIKGVSHLKKLYKDIEFRQNTFTMDLTPYGDLKAGDTSVIEDNYINSLDISTQVKNLYTNDTKNDLNRDSVVNSADISNTLHNLYLFGDD